MRKPKGLRNILWVPVHVLLALILIVLLGPLHLLWCTGRWIRQTVRLRRFCREKAGSVYLICGTRRGWYDFLQNNVASALPEEVNVLWYNRKRNQVTRNIELLLPRCKAFGLQKPFLVVILQAEVKVASLHQHLLDLKQHAAKNEVVRKKTRDIIECKMKNLRSYALPAGIKTRWKPHCAGRCRTSKPQERAQCKA